MAQLLLLNGPPGIGKSTIARRYAADRPGVLVCDVDVLRTMISGWQDDFAGAGALIRPVALAMIRTYLEGGHDVVLPQLLMDPAEVARFEACAAQAGAAFVERFLMDDVAAAVARFGRRGADSPDDPWHDHVRRIVADEGGEEALAGWHADLERLLAERPAAQVIHSAEGDVEATYRALLASL